MRPTPGHRRRASNGALRWHKHHNCAKLESKGATDPYPKLELLPDSDILLSLVKVFFDDPPLPFFFSVRVSVNLLSFAADSRSAKSASSRLISANVRARVAKQLNNLDALSSHLPAEGGGLQILSHNGTLKHSPALSFHGLFYPSTLTFRGGVR